MLLNDGPLDSTPLDAEEEGDDDVLVDVLVAADEALPSLISAPMLEDVLVAADSTAGNSFTAAAIEDVLVFSETISTEEAVPVLEDVLGFIELLDSPSLHAAPLVDALVASETLGGKLSISSLSSDTLAIREQAGAILFDLAEDTLILSEATPVMMSALAADALVISDQASGKLSISSIASDTLTASDSIGSMLIAMSVDVLQVGDSIDGVVSLHAPLLEDVLVASEEAEGAASLLAPLLEDVLVALEESGGHLSISAMSSDALVMADQFVGAGGQVIAVTNIETGAVSTYVLPHEVTCVAEFRGKLYFAGPNGLYALDAEADDAEGIPWRVRTGFNNMGSHYFKRIQDVDVLAKAESPVALRVVADRVGKKETVAYTQVPLRRDAYRDGVVRVGKGIHSIYYQIAVSGLSEAEIDQLRITVAQLSRRR